MTKTSSALLALALAASTFATGCALGSGAVDGIDCSDCGAPTMAAPETRLTMRQASDREAALAAWTIRLADGEDDACDERVVRYFEERATHIVLDGCEASFIPVLGIDHPLPNQGPAPRTTRAFAAGHYDIEGPHALTPELVVGDFDIEDPNAVKPVLVEVGELTAAEREWMLLGLDLSKKKPLTARQDMMLGRADELVFHERDEPRFAPEYL